MTLFNFQNSTQKQISADAATIGRVMREVIQMMESGSLTYSVKSRVSSKLSSIETESHRIVNNINSLSDSKIMSTRIPWINGELISANQWVMMFSMMMGEVAEMLES